MVGDQNVKVERLLCDLHKKHGMMNGTIPIGCDSQKDAYINI